MAINKHSLEGHIHDETYYTKPEVDKKITDAVTDVDVDLSGYITKVEASSTYASISAVDNKVDRVSGKGLSTNDYTTAEKNKLAVLENYEHPDTHVASMIVQNSSYRFVTDAEKSSWDSKSNFSGNYNDLESKPHLFSGSYNDLSNKPTIPTVDVDKAYVDAQLATKANSSEMHAHSNKAVIDIITNSKITEWNNKLGYEDTGMDMGGGVTFKMLEMPGLFIDAYALEVQALMVEQEVYFPKVVSNSAYINDLTTFTIGSNDTPVPQYRYWHQGTFDPTTKADKSYVDAGLGLKIDKVTGKDLSENNYTNSDKDYVEYLKEFYEPTTPYIAMEKLYAPHCVREKYVEFASVGHGAYNFPETVTDTTGSLITLRYHNEYEYEGETFENVSYYGFQLYTPYSGSNKGRLFSRFSSSVEMPMRLSADEEETTEWEMIAFTSDLNNLTPSQIADQNSGSLKMWTGTQAEYDAITTKDEGTLYHIKGSTVESGGSGGTHEHGNKDVLDAITSTKVVEWNNKSTFDGNYNSLSNKPTIPTNNNQLTNGAGYITMVRNTRDNSEVKFWVGTKAQYDAIGTKDANTIYNVIEG